MIQWLGAALLLGGSLLCLLAAVGVLRLPDFFMRMHAATKAGVAGSGLVLLGVAALDGSPSTWIKALLAVAFLLLTTPVAGHLIGRAGYVSGQPLWPGTREDALANVLPRGDFATQAGAPRPVARVVVALAEGPGADEAITHAIRLAREHGTELCGLAVIDVPRLGNVGPVPLGAGWHAQQMREHRIAQARRAAANVLQRYETAVQAAGLTWSSRLEEGHPRKVLRQVCDGNDLLVAAAGSWFDQGVLRLQVDVASRLDWPGMHPLRIVR
jgi:monovalent cation/proton antiporter MnhG/PhaG subunit